MRSFLLLFLFLITACAVDPSPMGKPLPHFDFSPLKPHSVRGGHVDIRKGYLKFERPRQAEFIRSPDITLENYAYSRFATQGGSRRMVFDIQKLNMTKKEQSLEYFDSLFGDKRDLYMLDLFISMIPVREGGRAGAPYTISINRKLVLTPDMSVAEREFRQFEFLEKAMRDLDKAVTKIIAKENG